MFLVDQLRLKKFRNVDDGGDDNDGYDVHENPGADGPASQGLSVVERMTDSSVPENNKQIFKSSATKIKLQKNVALSSLIIHIKLFAKFISKKHTSSFYRGDNCNARKK